MGGVLVEGGSLIRGESDYIKYHKFDIMTNKDRGRSPKSLFRKMSNASPII